eukprot:3612225-Amphidinium_carterae.1
MPMLCTPTFHFLLALCPYAAQLRCSIAKTMAAPKAALPICRIRLIRSDLAAATNLQDPAYTQHCRHGATNLQVPAYSSPALPADPGGSLAAH